MASSDESGQTVKGIALDNTVPGRGRRIGIVHTQWNKEIINSLLSGAKSELISRGVLESDIVIESVPGAYELPFGAKCMLERQPVQAVICLGCLIKGETMHFEYIAEAVTQGIMRLGLDQGVPVIFGVLTVLNESQAFARSGLNGQHNHGTEWAQTALHMAGMAERAARKRTPSARERWGDA